MVAKSPSSLSILGCVQSKGELERARIKNNGNTKECPQCARARVSETTRDEARKRDYRDSRATRAIIAPNLTEVMTFVATRSLQFYLQQILFCSKYC